MLQKTKRQTTSTADGKTAPKQTSSFHPTLLQHWCGLFWPAFSQRKKISCKALWLPLHLPGDKSSTPRNCTLTRDRQLYIMALRRMMARRGKPRNIYSDNGTNFLGAERELKEYLDGMDQAKISDTLSQDRIQWFFNPPSAPHFGGV